MTRRAGIALTVKGVIQIVVFPATYKAANSKILLKLDRSKLPQFRISQLHHISRRALLPDGQDHFRVHPTK